MTEIDDAGRRAGRKPARRRTCAVCGGVGTVPISPSDPRKGDKQCNNCGGLGELSFTPWMTADETAAYTRRHVDTVRAACAAGQLVAEQECAGAPWTVHMDDADAWIRRRRGALRAVEKTG